MSNRKHIAPKMTLRLGIKDLPVPSLNLSQVKITQEPSGWLVNSKKKSVDFPISILTGRVFHQHASYKSSNCGMAVRIIVTILVMGVVTPIRYGMVWVCLTLTHPKMKVFPIQWQDDGINPSCSDTGNSILFIVKWLSMVNIIPFSISKNHAFHWWLDNGQIILQITMSDGKATCVIVH